MKIKQNNQILMRNPYKYLDYYSYEDSDLFFGREAQVQKMVGEIFYSRFLVLFSPSGSGKTSLINAGVRPRLEEMGYLTVYSRFEPSVQIAVARALQLPDVHPSTELYVFLKAAVEGVEKPLVIFLDQFEEFFLIYREQPEKRKGFIRQLAEIRYDTSLPIVLVLSLREDYFALLHEFRGEIPSVFQNNANIRLEPFKESEARRAIEKPLKAVDAAYEDGLVDTLMHDLKEHRESIEPITLQIVCHTLWQNRQKETLITWKDYERLGGVASILRRHVEEVLRKIPFLQQRLMLKVFEALKTSENTKHFRDLKHLKETLRIKNVQKLRRLLKRLTDLRLLRHEHRQGTDWYEFKHDYLVEKIAAWMLRRKERIQKKLMIFGIIPGVLLFWGIVGSFVIGYNTYYAEFTNPVYEAQREEIIIAPGWEPFDRFVSTGYFKEDTRNLNARNALRDKVKLGMFNQNDWMMLVNKLNLAESGVLLYKLGKETAGIDTLLTALTHKGIAVYERAVSALAILGEADPRVLPKLLETLSDKNTRVRLRSVRILRHLNCSASQIGDALLHMLADEDVAVRGAAVEALGKCGICNQKVLSGLLKLLRKDNDSEVRMKAANALSEIGLSELQVINALLKALTDRESNVKIAAATALGKLGAPNKRVLQALLNTLTAENAMVKKSAVSALGDIGYATAKIRQSISKCLNDENPSVQIAAVVAIKQLAFSDPEALTMLLSMLKHLDWEIRSQAIFSLEELGFSDQSVMPALLRLTGDQKAEVRAAALRVLGSLGNDNAEIQESVVQALNDESPLVKSMAAGSLIQLGYQQKEMVKILVEMLGNKNTLVREAVLTLLGRLELREPLITEALLKMLADEEASTRAKVVALLGNLSEKDVRVTAFLLTVLKDEAANVRKETASVLNYFADNDEFIFEALLAALKDEVTEVQIAAATALGKRLQIASDQELMDLLVQRMSGYRMAAAYALLCRSELTQAVFRRVNQLKAYERRPWVRSAAWEAYWLLRERQNAEEAVMKDLKKANALFAHNKWTYAAQKYQLIFKKVTTGIQVNNREAAYVKFQQARCLARLKRSTPAIQSLRIALKYQPDLRERLQKALEQRQPEWDVFQENRYVRTVLLRPQS